MANRKKARLPVGPAIVKEALRRHIGDASRALRSPALSDEMIHRARKDLKAARANLRLLRPAITKADYRRENAALRDAARPLSGVRDARAMIDTVGDLVEDENNAARRELLLKLRTGLERARLAAATQAGASGVAETSAAALEAAWARVDGWNIERARASDVRKGVKRIYRNARQAFTEVLSAPDSDNLHEWRKQVKYFRNALETCQVPEATRVTKLLTNAEALVNYLGTDHDLIVLQNAIAKLHTRASGARTGLFGEIDARRTKLQSKAIKQGRRLFKHRVHNSL